jgi:hypothetical protein
MKHCVFFLVLLLSACSSDFWTVKSKAPPQPHPVARQHPAPVEVQPPAHPEPVIPPPQKREHNIEED